MDLLILFLSLFFLAPILKIVTLFIGAIVSFIRLFFNLFFKNLSFRPQSKFLQKVITQFKDLKHKTNRVLGLIEYIIRAPRNIFVGGYIFIHFILKALSIDHFPISLNAYDLGLIILMAIIYWTHCHQRKISLELAEFARNLESLHPHDFFETFYQLLGPFRFKIPSYAEVQKVNPASTSFKKHIRSTQKGFILIHALWDTAHLAHISLKSLKYVGKEYAREIFDIMASMWGKRILEITNSSLMVKGADQLSKLDGKVLLIFNHKSQLDFVLTFFALSQVLRADHRGIRPRFITAKDHFLDNKFVYEVLGVGKLIETVDMVFIERKKKGRAIQNLVQAAEFLSEKNIEIAIFPQGTRAAGNTDRSDKRRDAGYYTTVSPKDVEDDLGHLRKGTAFLALDTLIELNKTKQHKLHLVFIGISGTATILSKQSLKMQTETDVIYEIGEPVTLDPEMSEGTQKPEHSNATNEAQKRYLERVDMINHLIDEKLSETLHIHEHLKHRFLVDLQGYFRFGQDRIDIVSFNMDEMSKQTSLIYQILDRIYALPPHEWNAYLSQLAQLILEGRALKRLPDLRTQVTIKLLESTNVKLHGKKIDKSKIHKK